MIGQIAVTQAFLPLLRRGRGRIVNMGSIAGRGTIPLLGPYSASKFALEALTDALRMELQPWGIQVSIIEPGRSRRRFGRNQPRRQGTLKRRPAKRRKALYGEAVIRIREVDRPIGPTSDSAGSRGSSGASCVDGVSSEHPLSRGCGCHSCGRGW